MSNYLSPFSKPVVQHLKLDTNILFSKIFSLEDCYHSSTLFSPSITASFVVNGNCNTFIRVQLNPNEIVFQDAFRSFNSFDFLDSLFAQLPEKQQLELFHQYHYPSFTNFFVGTFLESLLKQTADHTMNQLVSSYQPIDSCSLVQQQYGQLLFEFNLKQSNTLHKILLNAHSREILFMDAVGNIQQLPAFLFDNLVQELKIDYPGICFDQFNGSSNEQFHLVRNLFVSRYKDSDEYKLRTLFDNKFFI